MECMYSQKTFNKELNVRITVILNSKWLSDFVIYKKTIARPITIKSEYRFPKRMFFQTMAKVVKFRFIVNKKRKL